MPFVLSSGRAKRASVSKHRGEFEHRLVPAQPFDTARRKRAAPTQGERSFH
jgi:hypothetical protein